MKKRIINKDLETYCLEVEKFHNFALSAGVFVKNCGFGEPFVNDDLKYLIEEVKNKGVFVGLISNGSLLKEKLPALLQNPNFLPHYISISLNASSELEHEKTTGTKTFKKVLEGIKLSIESGIETYVSYVCTRENINDIPDFLNLVYNLGVRTVHLHNLLPHFKDEENDEFWKLALQKGDEGLFDSVKKHPYSDIVKLYPTFIDKNETRRYCHFPWKSVAVNGNKSISVCNSVYPCNKKNGTLDDPLLWRNEYCQEFRRSILTEQKPACKKCFRNWEVKPC